MFFKRRGDGSRAHRVVLVKPDQYFVCGVLQPGCRFVQLAGRLGGQLAQFVTVPDMAKAPNIRSERISLFSLSLTGSAALVVLLPKSHRPRRQSFLYH